MAVDTKPPVTSNGNRSGTTQVPAPAAALTRDVVVPFLIGTAVGGVAGAVAGTLLSNQTSHLVAALIDLVDRRLTDAERDKLRFELLLQ